MDTTEYDSLVLYAATDYAVKETICNLRNIYSTTYTKESDNIVRLATILNITDCNDYDYKHHLYVAVATRLIDRDPCVYYWLPAIAMNILRNSINTVCMLLNIPINMDHPVSDLICHVSICVQSRQLLCVYGWYGIQLDIFDPNIHTLIVARSNDGYYVQGIDVAYRFDSNYLPYHKFNTSSILGGWFVPTRRYTDFMTWIDTISLNL